MLKITVPAAEFWDEIHEEFVYKKEQTLQLEHSLQIAESLSSTIASTVVGVMLGYFFKALFETFFERREERLKQESEPEENTNYEEV